MLNFSHFATLCAAALLLTGPTPLAAQDTERCQIVRTAPSGVLVRRGSRQATAVVGLVVNRGDRIETRRDARATILCDTGLTMTIGPETVILLDRLMTPGRGASGVQLMEGIAGFLLGRPREGGFEVRTPSAVLAVRSTEWAVAVESRSTAAFVHEGAVRITGRSRAVVLSDGEGVDVDPQGAVGEIKTWGQGRIDGFAERLGTDWRAQPAR